MQRQKDDMTDIKIMMKILLGRIRDNRFRENDRIIHPESVK